MFEIETQTTRDGIRAALDRQAAEIGEFISGLPVDEFLTPQGEHWSPERHLRHLNKSVGAVASGLKAPKIALRLRFGRPRRDSESFEEVVERYRAALAAGGRASGRYEPSPLPPDVDHNEWREGVLDRWRERSRQLSAALPRWSEKALDRHQAEHPLLGKMTVREILFFTLYHNGHHARRIAERRPAGADGST